MGEDALTSLANRSALFRCCVLDCHTLDSRTVFHFLFSSSFPPSFLLTTTLVNTNIYRMFIFYLLNFSPIMGQHRNVAALMHSDLCKFHRFPAAI